MNILKTVMARKNMTTSIENDLQKEIKKLAIDLERPFNDIIEEIEKCLIADALVQHNGNKVKTADTLQIPLRSLHRKIKKYQL